MEKAKQIVDINIKKKNRHIITLIILRLFNVIGTAIIFPLIPNLLINTNSSYYLLNDSTLNQYAFFVQGIILMIYGLFVFLSAPILGQLSDYYGRKRLLNICLLGSAIGYFLFAYSILTLNIWLLIFSRIIDGITGGNIAIIQASMGDISEPKEMKKNISRLSSTIGIGFILGTLLGGLLSSSEIYHLFNPSTPLIFAGVLTLISLYLCSAYLIEAKNNNHNEDDRFSIKKLNPLHSFEIIKSGFKMKELRLFLITLLLFWIGFTTYSNFSNNYLLIRFGFDERGIGYYLATVGIILTICQLFVVPYINRIFSSFKVLKITYLLLSISLVIYAGFIFNVNILYLFLPFFVLLVSIIIVNINIEIMSRTSQENRGKIFGITSSVQSMSQTIAPLLGGIVSTIFYYDSPFYLAAIITFVAAVLLWIWS